VCALVAAPAVVGAQPVDLASLADRVFAPWNRADAPGCAVGVARGGRTALLAGYGMADLESQRAIGAETIFESGSVAKQFTASAIVLLALDGRLSLDDDVRKWIPELPTYDAPITIRHLLNHTSGLREWSALVAAQGWERGRRAHQQADLLAIITAQRALNYPVGQTYSYTNSGFALLPTIVERASGQSFAAFTRARLFDPAGMTHTRWRDDFTAVVPGRAPAYAPRGREWRLAMPFEDVHGPGGLLTTAADWLRWNEALDGKQFGAPWADTLVHRSRTRDGREIAYALGVVNDRYRGTREWSHSGATGGYRTFLARYPDLGRLSIAVLCNAASADPTALTHALVDGLHPELTPARRADTTMVDAAGAARWVGRWRHAGAHTFARVDGVDGRLVWGGVRLWPAGDGSWVNASRSRRLVDVARTADRVTRGLLIGAEDDTTVVERVADPDTSAATLAGFAGQYRSEEIDATYVVSIVDGRVRVQLRPGYTVSLAPAYRDGFESDALGAVFFSRDARGRVSALHVANGRMWDLVFRRVDGARR
jgi:CubicO group peptidase (beta-lactamase class C family)